MGNPQAYFVSGYPKPKTTGSKTLVVQWYYSTKNSSTKKWTEIHPNDTDSFTVEWKYYIAQSNGSTMGFFGSIATVKYSDWSQLKPSGETYPRRSWVSEFTIPDGAQAVGVRIKPVPGKIKIPVSSSQTTGGKLPAITSQVINRTIGGGGITSETTTSYTEKDAYTASWNNQVLYNNNKLLPLDWTGEIKTALVDNGANLEVTYDTGTGTNSTIGYVQFNCIKDDSAAKVTSSWVAVNAYGHATYKVTSLATGAAYKVRGRITGPAKTNTSQWSEFTENVMTKPNVPTWVSLRALKVNRDTKEFQLYLEWNTVAHASTYTFEYAESTSYFDSSTEVQSFTTEEGDYRHRELNLPSEYIGKTLYFRFRANGDSDRGSSGWAGFKSISTGFKPEPPSTWSTAESVRLGEPVTLQWVHNSIDGSEQTKAEIRYKINNNTEVIKSISGNTSYYNIPSTLITTDSVMEWSVRTYGAYPEWSDYSVTRKIQFFSNPSVDISMDNLDGGTLKQFPIKTSFTVYPSNQNVLSYHISVESNDLYTTTDKTGIVTTISKGQTLYSKVVDDMTYTLITEEPEDWNSEEGEDYYAYNKLTNEYIKLERPYNEFKGWTYYILNSESPHEFHELIEAQDLELRTGYSYKLVVSIMTDVGSIATSDFDFDVELDYIDYTCEKSYIVMNLDVMTAEIHPVCHIPDTNDEDERILVLAENTKLSIYRISYDGEKVLIDDNIDNDDSYVAVDPHPSLDVAKYRVVALDTITGSTTCTDIEYVVDYPFAIIQWGEQSSYYHINEMDDVSDEVAYSGNMVILAYNLDISESFAKDTSNINYIGRENPVAYYGTQLGITSSWSCVIDKEDTDTLYSLRELSKYMGDVYVREPNGVGYWANVSVSFSRTHMEVTIPVTIEITRVEGGK